MSIVHFLSILILSAGPAYFGIEPSFALDKSTIPAGAPLGMILDLKLGPGGESIRAAFVENDDIHIRVMGPGGAVVTESKKRGWRCTASPRHVWYARFRGGPVVETRRYLAFNEWCSTDLPAGRYTVEIALLRLGPLEVGQTTFGMRELDPPPTFSLPLTVHKRNDNATAEEFERLLAEASKPMGGAGHEKHKETARAVELIVYSRDPLALPAQLELLSGRIKMWSTTFVTCHAVDLLLNLINRNSPEVAKGLVKAHEDLYFVKYPFESSSRYLLMDLVVWAIHELHAKGDPEVAAHTAPFVQSHPKTVDPLSEAFNLFN